MTVIPAELRQAAFGDRPGLDVARWAAGAGWAAWTAAVVLGGQGRYAAAGTVLRGLSRQPDRLLAAHARITLASHRRQLGGHAPAAVLDGAALHGLVGLPPGARVPAELAGAGLDPDAARCDALLGLAADNLGFGRLMVAGRLLDRAAPAADGSWRTRVRAGWIGAELALAGGRAAEAVAPAEAALTAARGAGSVRHELKSELVRWVISATLEEADAATGLNSVVERATQRALLPLVWPAALLLVDLASGRAEEYSRIATKALVRVLRGADPEIARRAAESPWVPWHLLRSGDVTSPNARSKNFTD